MGRRNRQGRVTAKSIKRPTVVIQPPEAPEGGGKGK